MPKIDETLDSLILTLNELKLAHDGNAPDWREETLRTYVNFFGIIGLPPDLLVPATEMYLEAMDARSRAPGPKLTSSSVFALGTAAAAVTVLHSRQRARGAKVRDSAEEIARASGIETERIVGYRNQINRGRYGDEVQIDYKRAEAEFQELKDLEILRAVACLGKFVQ